MKPLSVILVAFLLLSQVVPQISASTPTSDCEAEFGITKSGTPWVTGDALVEVLQGGSVVAGETFTEAQYNGNILTMDMGALDQGQPATLRVTVNGHDIDSTKTVPSTPTCTLVYGSLRPDNEPPVVTVEFDSLSFTDQHDMVALPAITDPDGDTVGNPTYQWSYIRGGTEFVANGASTTTFSKNGFQAGDTLKITVDVTDQYGLRTNPFFTIRVGSIDDMPIPDIQVWQDGSTITKAIAGDVRLDATGTVDGTAGTPTPAASMLYQWDTTGDGTYETTLDSANIELDATVTPSQLVEMSLRVIDAEGYRAHEDFSFWVNTAPSLDTFILPTLIQAGDVVSITPTGSDADNNDASTDNDDTLSFSYVWRHGDKDCNTLDVPALQSTTDAASDSLPANLLPPRGDCLILWITLSDGHESVTGTATQVISNSAPELGLVTIDGGDVTEPVTASIADLASAAAPTFDADGDDVDCLVTWTVAGTAGTQSTAADCAAIQLGAGEFSRGDVVSLEIQATDGEGQSAAQTDSFTIENALPQVGAPTLLATDVTGPVTVQLASLNRDGDQIFDADGDTVLCNAIWKVGTTTVEVQNGIDCASAFLDAGIAEKGAQVTLQLTPVDGIDQGTMQSGMATISNAAPSAFALSLDTLSGKQFQAGEEPVISYSVSDPDAADSLQCQVTWFKNDDEAETTAWDACTDVTWATPGLVRGDVVLANVAVTDGTDTFDVDSNTVTMLNFVPELGVVSITLGDTTQDATVSIANLATGGPTFDRDTTHPVNADTVTCNIIWAIEGVNEPQRNGVSCTEASLDASKFVREDRIGITITPTDGQSNGVTQSLVAFVTQNAAPSIGTPTLSSFDVTEDAVVTFSEAASDPDGDTVACNMEWFIDEVSQGISTAACSAVKLPAGSATHGELVYVEVTPRDQFGATGEPQTSNIIEVSNAEPTISGITYSFEGVGTAPRAGDVQSVTFTVNDPDGMTGVTCTVEWWTGETLVESDDSCSTSSFTTPANAKGDSYLVQIMVNDGEARSPVGLATPEVQNSPPVATATLIAQGKEPGAAILEADVLEATISVTDADVDDDHTCTVSWFQDGTLYAGPTPADCASIHRLTGSNHQRGETWSVQVIADDGTDSHTDEHERLIANALPSIQETHIVTSAQEIVVTATASDPDADPVTCDYQWFRALDSEDELQLDDAASNDCATGTTLQIDNHPKGSYFVRITPNDGFEDGPATETTSEIDIANHDPEFTELSITPAQPRTGDAISATSSTKDVDDDDVTVTYTWFRMVGGEPVEVSTDISIPASATTKAEQWQLQATATDGDGGSAEQIHEFTIGDTPPTATVQIAPANPHSLLDVSATGAGQDADGDTVTLSYIWSASGKSPISGKDLPASQTSPGDVWTVTVTPIADGVSGAPARASVTILSPPDSDSDGKGDHEDNCLNTPNGNQANYDGDEFGDACDDDDDNDGVLDSDDAFPRDETRSGDADNDGIDNFVDNCVDDANTNQADNDGDGIGDVCDEDDEDGPTGDQDGDGANNTNDNCPADSNANQADGDDDGRGDACDSNLTDGPGGDADGDNVTNRDDNCPDVANANQANHDNDAMGDACDDDDDNDGASDVLETARGSDPLDEDSLPGPLAFIAPIVTVEGNGLKLTWNSVNGATGYNVFRSSSPYALIATTTSAQYMDTSVEDAKQYKYRVVAYDAYGKSTDPSLVPGFDVAAESVYKTAYVDSDGDGIRDSEDSHPNDASKPGATLILKAEEQPDGKTLLTWSTTGDAKPSGFQIVVDGKVIATLGPDETSYLLPAGYNPDESGVRPLFGEGSQQSESSLITVSAASQDTNSLGAPTSSSIGWLIPVIVIVILAILIAGGLVTYFAVKRRGAAVQPV